MMSKIYYALKAWCDETFGRNRDPEAFIAKLEEEVVELIAAVRTHENFKTRKTSSAMQEEIADVTMVVFHLAQRYGICYDTFVENIITKHNVNRERKWVQMPDGRWKHLPDDTKITDK
jgi:NTP pyrophosphatase (non-canonical NTP hydrolase)